MKASSANLLTVIKGPKQFVIPIYQRTYSWQISQCNKLLNDILKVSADPTLPGHFIGSVVYFQESIHTVSDVPRLLVIDGQQRITTVSLLIAALADFMKKHESSLDTNFSKLQNYYLLNPEEDGDLKYKLLLTKRDKETFINIVNGIQPEGDYSLRVVENFEFFKEKINSENVSDIYNGILRLFVVDVALEKDKDNPQLIFESMNSTGLDLSQADLIRNYVLMGQDIKVQTKLYEKYWYPMERGYGNDYASTFNSFMRDYLSVKTGMIPQIDRVYEQFKIYVRDSKDPDVIAGVVQDIEKFSRYYVNIVLHKEPDQDLQRGFRALSKLKVDVSYPFLLPVYNDFCDGLISKSEFLEIVSLIESYVFRRAICGIPTNSLNKTFVTLYKAIVKENYVESLQAAFQGMESYKRFPSDIEFRKEIALKDVYNFRPRNYLLNNLENYGRKELVNIDACTIEHVMPQNPDLSTDWQIMLGDTWKEVQQSYLHTLGNLTLTGYNSELSDRSFQRKKVIEGGFNDSPLRLNRYMKSVDVWTEEQIIQRAEELAGKAIEIWKFPNLTDEVMNRYIGNEEKGSADYDLDSYEFLKGDKLELYFALRKRVMNVDSSVKEEFKKLYIAFKSVTNFVDIVPQKSRLRLSLNIEFDKIHDPLNLCKDVTNLGRWGNGDVEVGLQSLDDLDNVMDLVQQAFDAQFENV
ncbi:Predicted transport protein [Dyadobacter koreensis]|uniref:Predicted transport protein n=1 Tax=Dyadobacter koreensis TaxID=408657 RepID=A0A1H6YWL0_9BACT|nr:DUF262 and DUF1524 domain-containing protein [Dyadobacter koreensis]SEJ41690.1 Predicted transport protein [Dyadobacter koreensis]